MVQAVRPSGGENLSRYLARLASNPRDVDALIGAGEAALEMEDVRAASGFFERANAVQPNNGRVKAGQGRIMLKTQNPAEALRLFDQAMNLGVGEATLLADRGLARDMTGDQAGAQRDYQTALRRAPDDSELITRYAASLGISGQVEAAEKVLQPLLYKSDRAAWRYRAFIMAMNNRQDEARKIASQTMPAQLASAITPYMQKMPYLTPAQKAAAVHFGHFPARIGTTIAAVTPTPPARIDAPATTASSGSSSAQPRQPSQAFASRTPVPSHRPALAQPAQTPAPAVPPARRQLPPTPSATARPSQPAPAPTTLAQAPQPRPAPRASSSSAAPVQGPPAPGFESLPSRTPAPSAAPATAGQLDAPHAALSPAAPSSGPTNPSAASGPVAPPARQQPNPEATRSLADIIRAIDVPDAERRTTVAAVDLAEIEAMHAARRAEQQAAAEKAKKAAAAKAKADAAAAKAKAEADAKAKKAAEEKARLAANPSRNWLQVGTGADRGALAFTLKGLRRKYDAISPQDGWVATWGRTNRLLIGPFPSFSRAKTLETKLKAAGADVFAWQSDAGEVVERLPGK